MMELSKNILLLLAGYLVKVSNGECLSNPSLDAEFLGFIQTDDASVTSIPLEGSCCQSDVCGLPCPEPVPDPAPGFGITILVFIGISFCIGIGTYFVVKNKAENFFVAGRSLPLWIVIATLASQSIDSNALLGNADLSYKFHFWDGAVLPIGLGLSLINNGIFFAAKINEDNVLTLPDVYAKRYGKAVEIMVSIVTIISFTFLLGGNLVGMAAILSYLLGISQTAGVWLSGSVVWAYTVSGGLYSVAYTDVLQATVGWLGCLSLAFYLISNEQGSATPSIGIPGYVYPDDATCAMYDGVPCSEDASLCCFNEAKWCPDGECTVGDNMAYPFGDLRVFNNEMTEPHALTPFPNAIFFNWATIFILGFGNLGALDFQARCMASKTPRVATIGCFCAGIATFIVGIPFAYLGAITRVYYGPDSVHAEFATDTCSVALGLPTCAQWLPDPQAFIKLLTHQAPPFLGAWCLIGIVAASMSTSDGAILAMGTVFSHNILRHVGDFISEKNLLMIARIATVPFALIATLIAAYYNSSHPSGATGYLLIVAFDVVLATVVAPLFGAFYLKKPSANAAIVSIIFGAATRVILEFALPKDGYLILPWSGDEFLDYGAGANSLFPPFLDMPSADLWDVTDGTCEQTRLEDYTGVDSMIAFAVSIVTYLLMSLLERNGPLFTLPFTTPYEKELGNKSVEDDDFDDEA